MDDLLIGLFMNFFIYLLTGIDLVIEYCNQVNWC